jgi:hypothetical protein
LKASRCGPRLSNTPRAAIHRLSRRNIDVSAGTPTASLHDVKLKCANLRAASCVRALG